MMQSGEAMRTRLESSKVPLSSSFQQADALKVTDTDPSVQPNRRAIVPMLFYRILHQGL